MASEIQAIIAIVRQEIEPLPRKELLNSYIDLVEQTVTDQHEIIMNYEQLVKKLEKQLINCQVALDESTKREIEQVTLIMDMKLSSEMNGESRNDDGDCGTCECYEKENSLLREQTEQQAEIIDKLGKAQELLMLQYQVLEMGLNSELSNIARCQEEINNMKFSTDETANTTAITEQTVEVESEEPMVAAGEGAAEEEAPEEKAEPVGEQ